jgi:3-oxoacyl-[acyl-carrier-protein] synthase II
MDKPLAPVAITGVGVIAATGPDVQALDNALREGRDGVGELTLWDSPLADFPVGQVRDDLPELLDSRIEIPARTRKRLTRADMLALAATAEALGQAGLQTPELESGNAGVYLGQSVCGTLVSEDIYIRAVRQAHESPPPRLTGMLFHEGAHTLDMLASLLRLPGPSMALMTACSSGANAIGLAADRIRAGRASVMVAGGSDSLSQIAFNGFCSLKVVSPDGPRPFDHDRQGMMLGEGAGVLVLEDLEHAQRRGAKALALLTGYGHSCDAHHLTAPHPEGRGARLAMAEALAQAGISPGEVDYVNAHGTATLDNDRTEAIALEALFGPDGVPVSSTKRFTGHTLAAAGGVEAVIAVWALMHGMMPRNLGLREKLEGASIDVVHETREAALRHVVSSSFGFGGNNAALVISAPEAVTDRT